MSLLTLTLIIRLFFFNSKEKHAWVLPNEASYCISYACLDPKAAGVCAKGVRWGCDGGVEMRRACPSCLCSLPSDKEGRRYI